MNQSHHHGDTWSAILVFIGVIIPALANGQIAHERKTISAILRDDRSCVFFSLTAVAQADPAVSGSETFAIDRTTASSADQMALLMSAYLNKTPVTVTTSGGLACGHAKVASISLR